MRNLVLLTIDALRANNCGFLGYERDTTPNMDRLIDDSLVCRNAVASGTNTPTSMVGVFSGERATVDVEAAPVEDWRSQISKRWSFVQTLSEMGYSTAAIHPQVHASSYFGFDKGFEYFEDFLSPDEEGLKNQVLEKMFEGSELWYLLRNLRAMISKEEAFKPWESYYSNIIEWREEVSEPYFLWLHLPDTHLPYLPPRSSRKYSNIIDMYYMNLRCYHNIGESNQSMSESFRQTAIDVYDDSIRYADRFVGELVSDLNEDDPIIAIHGDHGEAFWEHGFYGHQAYPYNEVTHVPLLFYNGGNAGEITEPVSLLDIGPTLLDLIGEQDFRVGGESILSEKQKPWAVTKVNEGDDTVTGIRTENWKYVDKGRDYEPELYNTKKDPSETKDVAGRKPELVELFENIKMVTENGEIERQRIRDEVSHL